jgi:hypothetical protein
MQYILYYEYNSNAELLGANISFHDINKRDQIISFLDSKVKSIEDQDKKWITTWNELKSGSVSI